MLKFSDNNGNRHVNLNIFSKKKKAELIKLSDVMNTSQDWK